MKPLFNPKPIIYTVFALLFVTYSMERFMSDHIISGILGVLMVVVFAAVAVKSIPTDKNN